MITNKSVLESKIQEGESTMCEYLIDNAETDEQVEAFQALRELSILLPKDDKRYLSVRNEVLFSIGIDVSELQT